MSGESGAEAAHARPDAPLAGRRFALVLLWLMGIAAIGLAAIYWRLYGRANLFGDFPIFYQASRHAAAGQWGEIYRVAAVRAHFTAQSNEPLLLFLNPPPMLFLLYPLHWLSEGAALWLWLACQAGLLALTLRQPYFQKLFTPWVARGIATPWLLGVAFAAYGLQCLFYGQVTLFCTALFLLVMAWRKPRPVWAGVMLGLLSLKPQLGLLLPLLLLAEGNYKTLLWAIFTAAALGIASLACFDSGLWRDYSEITLLMSRYLARDQAALFSITSSAYAALRGWGAAAGWALTGQGLLALAVIAFIRPVFRRGEEMQKIVLLSLAAYLATPYALIYDMTLVAIPCAFLLRGAEADRARSPELLALMLLILMPVASFLLQLRHIPYSVIAIGFTLGVARMKPRAQLP